jgi:hypothetical protein
MAYRELGFIVIKVWFLTINENARKIITNLGGTCENYYT